VPFLLLQLSGSVSRGPRFREHPERQQQTAPATTCNSARYQIQNLSCIVNFNRDVDLADVAGSQDLAAGPADVAAQSAALKIVQMGSVTPAEDFQALIHQGLPLEEGKTLLN
jgi:hypothetical protein